jgi:hypothetical protein
MKLFKTLILFAALFSCREIKSQCLDTLKTTNANTDSITFTIYTSSVNDTSNLTIYNRWGAVVTKMLLDSVLQPGHHTIVYHPTASLVSGSYFYIFSSRGCSYRGTFTYLAPASINRYAATNIIKLSPNPCNGVFTIGSEFALITSIEIVNMLGNIVYQNSALTSVFNIDVSFLPAGIYYVRIIADGKPVIKKLIRE